MSSVITISQPPTVPGDKASMEPSEGITFAPAPDSDEDLDEFEDPFEDAPLLGQCTPPSSSSGTPTAIPSIVCGNSQFDNKNESSPPESDSEDKADAKKKARVGSLEKLQGGLSSKAEGKAKVIAQQESVDENERKEREAEKEEEKDKLALHPVKIQPRRRSSRVPEAVIVLKEEKVNIGPAYAQRSLTSTQASTFHDFLCYVYPQCVLRSRPCEP